MLFPQSCGCETPGPTLRRSISRNGSVFREVFAVPSRTAIPHHPKPVGLQIRGRPHRPPLPGYADKIDDNPLDLNAFGKHGGTRIKVQNAGRRS
jgi:hypothetical protein